MIKRLTISFLEGLLALLEGLPQKEEAKEVSQVQDTQPVQQFLLTGEDRELIRQFLRSTKLTNADISACEPRYVHTYAEAD